MSAGPDKPFPFTDLFHSGQALARTWTDFLAKQQQAWLQQGAQQAGAAVPLPATDALGKLQREYLERHAELWKRMLEGKQDGAGQSGARNAADKRFASAGWQASPFYDYLRQAYLINASFLEQAAQALPLEEGPAKVRLRFLTRQFIEAMAPSNFAATNPEVIETALATKGQSITEGIKNLIADLEKGRVSMTDESAFEVGRNLGITPGAVVYQNELFQLIQYSAATEKVAERPLVIVPPCINKFYILDLQPENSFVRYAVEQGQTVFMVSWRNVKADLGHLTWDDYVEKGVLRALQVAREICRVKRVNAVGFCVGGTLLANALAVARARGEDGVESVTLLATLLDFSMPGDIANFVDEPSVVAREVAIGKGGLLRGAELNAAFSALRPNDLIWQYVVGNYLKGGKPPAFDLLYWNSDSTNLPGPFLTWYLRHCYLNNDLRVPGKLEVCGTRVDLGGLGIPNFILATRDDHIVPWEAAYLSCHILGGENEFVLGASGHIAGVVNSPAKNKRSYWVNKTRRATSAEWLEGATEVKGSWWPHWIEWLRSFGGKQRLARALGSRKYSPGEPAPGAYVKEKA